MAKGPTPTSFPPVSSTNVERSPKNSLTFSFNPTVTLVQNVKVEPKLLNMNHDHPLKMSNPYKVEITITTHRNAGATKL